MKGLFFAFFTTFMLFSKVRLEDKVKIDVLFESLCPDSRHFIKNQLYPNWKDIAPYVNLNLVPFGKSWSTEGGTKFICQHGPEECKGNKILSCALKLLPDQNLQVEYVNCFMRNYPKELGQVCALEIGLNFLEVMECYNSKKGTLAQLEAEQTTVKVLPKFVPTIIYNEVSYT
ncbi:hypothetical protein NQ318_006390 [Aromia moschata]|uniref:Uncharacterized protein n=1 Tax=Aromia moschata TaxID=1265417 RepID=A0AAV8YIM4_9CUCU|nr:hypothetical protein NQ318_006390 [Aromia moschata]